MITREYKCIRCGERIEQKCSIKEPILKRHKCGGELITIMSKNEAFSFSFPLLGARSKRYA